MVQSDHFVDIGFVERTKHSSAHVTNIHSLPFVLVDLDIKGDVQAITARAL
jgi:hypothetical protein